MDCHQSAPSPPNPGSPDVPHVLLDESDRNDAGATVGSFVSCAADPNTAQSSESLSPVVPHVAEVPKAKMFLAGPSEGASNVRAARSTASSFAVSAGGAPSASAARSTASSFAVSARKDGDLITESMFSVGSKPRPIKEFEPSSSISSLILVWLALPTSSSANPEPTFSCSANSLAAAAAAKAASLGAHGTAVACSVGESGAPVSSSIFSLGFTQSTFCSRPWSIGGSGEPTSALPEFDCG
mmetsp:Transcript_11350/g.26315  ORF Transcript_11350/g.26315 Transcript_11350/m.26315 type:complete len:241 (-) Transcript_11350:1552-2274(-)